MATSQTLLQIIARLQHHISVAHGRRMLLDYARKSTGARLALLFVVDRDHQTLVLLEKCGRAPRRAPSSIEIPLQGLFGSALHRHGFQRIPDIYSDSRSLPEERYWAWEGGQVLLKAVGARREAADQQGILVLCFGPRAADARPAVLEEGDLLICISLLSAYLSRSRSALPAPSREGQEAPVDAPEQRSSKVRLLDKYLRELTLLYEVGLAGNPASHEADQEIHRRLLVHLARVLDAQSGCFWLYHPSQNQFTLSTTYGDPTSYITSAAGVLGGLVVEKQAGHEEVRKLHVVSWSPDQMVILHPLRAMRQLVGAVAFSLPGESMKAAGQAEDHLYTGKARDYHCRGERKGSPLPIQQQLLFGYMCHAAAVVLRSQELRVADRQAAIDRERSRIARDIHDGVAQEIAHVIHKLEYTLRIFEKQPQLALREIGRARDTLEEGLRELRHGISSLVPVQLEHQSFDEALRALLDEFSKSEPRLKIQYDIEKIRHWPPSLEAAIYRLVQEALNNVRKHAQATGVRVRIRPLSGLLVVQVSDNGIGFDVEQAKRNAVTITAAKNEGSSTAMSTEPRLGLRTMQERVEQAGGILEIHSTPGAGTTVKARFPLATPSAILTNREREVLRLLVEGLTNRVIADRLSVSVETVKSHVHHIMQKMQVKDRTQAAVLATKQQWI